MKLKSHRRYEFRDWLMYPASTLTKMFEIWRNALLLKQKVLIDEWTYKVIIIKVYKVVDEEASGN